MKVSLIPEPIITMPPGSPNTCVPKDKKAKEYCVNGEFHYTLKCKKKNLKKNYMCD